MLLQLVFSVVAGLALGLAFDPLPAFGFIATIAFGRVFLLCFWRPAVASTGQAPSLPASPLAAPSFVPLVGLTLLVVFFGLFPESLLNLSQQAAAGLGNPEAYIQSVFSEGSRP